MTNQDKDWPCGTVSPQQAKTSKKTEAAKAAMTGLAKSLEEEPRAPVVADMAESSVEESLLAHGFTLEPEEWDRQRFQQLEIMQKAGRNCGHVELCEDNATGRLVAVKAMPISWTGTSLKAFDEACPGETERPWQDAFLTQYLDKVANLDCVCEFVGVFWRRNDNGVELCVVLSYCAGGDLFSWLERSVHIHGDEREEPARRLIRHALCAVSQVHAQGFAHGDLSLENMLIADNQPVMDLGAVKLKLIDFAASSGPRTSGARGKPSYQAPEMHTMAGYDALLADAFSVGVLAFTLISGNYPWRSTRPYVCMRFRYMSDRGFPAYLARQKVRHGTNEVVSLISLLSPGAASLLEGLLMIDPAQRLTVPAALEHPWLRQA
jgi:serine/threonine protein kinase